MLLLYLMEYLTEQTSILNLFRCKRGSLAMNFQIQSLFYVRTKLTFFAVLKKVFIFIINLFLAILSFFPLHHSQLLAAILKPITNQKEGRPVDLEILESIKEGNSAHFKTLLDAIKGSNSGVCVFLVSSNSFRK